MDMKKKVLFLVLGTLLFIMFYQIALHRGYDKLYVRVPGVVGYRWGRDEEPSERGVHKVVHFVDNDHHKHDDTSVADLLREKVRILCWVMTTPENHRSKAIHVYETWGKRCNKVVFATESEKDGVGLPLLIVNVTEGRDHLTAKTMQAFDQVYKKHLDEFEWFMKADDDTYVIVENLRYFLSDQDASQPIFFGHHFKPYVDQGYFSGGAGYILSREALSRFGRRGPYDCKKDEGAEDVEMGFCMQRLKVVAGDSRDALGRSRFHCFNPETHIHGIYPDWYRQYDKYGARKGIDSISDYAITFHYVSVEQMYNLEFYIYHLRPYGIISGQQELNVPGPGPGRSSGGHAHPSTSQATLSPSYSPTSTTPTTSTSSSPSSTSMTRPEAKRRRKRKLRRFTSQRGLTFRGLTS